MQHDRTILSRIFRSAQARVKRPLQSNRPTVFLALGTAILLALPGFMLLGSADPGSAMRLSQARSFHGTTLGRSIGIGETEPSDNGYRRLEYQQGWPLVIRQDMTRAGLARFKQRTPLVSFVHLTDVHIIDAQSPERIPFARKFGVPYRTDYRNQDALTLHVADSMVQQINALEGGPITRDPLSFAISTGDNGDGRQMNELRNYVNVLDGGMVTTDSSGEGYIGVQDSFVLPGHEALYDQYYHPDPPPAGIQPDLFKREYGFPEYPGLLEAATTNFEATGLDVPWYSAHGNHDSAVFGYFRAVEEDLELYWDPVGTGQIPDYGSQMFLDVPDGMDIEAFEGCLGSPTEACVTQIYTGTLKRPVPANPQRAQYLTEGFLQVHLDSPASPGPIGHGFSEDNLVNNTLYYTFTMSPEIVGIMLDTVNQSGKDSGSIGTIQADWLESQLQAYSSQYLDTSHQITTTVNADRMIVLFSHHNLLTLDNDTSLPGDPDPDKVLADEIEQLLLRYPNVILWINGHSHVNRVWPHRSFRSTAPLKSGFWEINTASHIDFPQQARTIEIVDNQDGTLSIFGVLIDHFAPPETDPARLDLLGLASISRELSVNDPDFWIDFQIGAPGDRNVELLIDRPFALQADKLTND